MRHRQSTQPEWIRELLAEARERGVSLQVSVIDVTPDQVEPSERVDMRAVQRLVASMRKKGYDGPPILAYENVTRSGYGVINGNHRLRAAILTGLATVPLAVVSDEANEFFMENDVGVVGIEEILEAANPALRLKSSGAEKHRTEW